MGKTQSKRSVDITTEAKKTPDEDVGKLEKIEDLDQKQVNGDASSQDNVETEALQKKDGDETENDKDLTTEKSGGESGAQDGGGDSNTGQSNTSAAESASKEDDSAASKDGNKTAEEISPLADENNKKPKKEKVKKKWSFRSISFGKKDKQKPAKAEDAATENAAATNSDAAAPAGEVAGTEETAEKVQKAEAAGDSEVKKSCDKPTENGDSSEKELNGEKTPTATTPIAEQPAKETVSNENATTNITNNTTETTNSVENNSTTATENNQTEKQTTTTATNVAAETPESTPAVVSNGDAIENNGTDTLSTVDDQKDQITDKAAVLLGEMSDVVEKIKNIPNVANEVSDNGVHQNGTSANGEELETEIVSKSQVEVIFQTDQAALTDDLVTLTTATTSSSPKAIPILSPDPNTETTKIDTDTPSSKSVITDFTESQNEETVSAAESAAGVVLDVALTAIEPVSTSPFSDTIPFFVANVDAGNEEPTKPESKNEKQAEQSPAESRGETEGEDLSTAVSATSTAQESPKPPPLPVSPPPSQVLVFAFNNDNDNNQVEEEDICATVTDIVAVIETSEPSSVPGSGDIDIDSKPDLQSTDDDTLHNKEDTTCDLPSTSIDITSAGTAQMESHTDTISTDVIEKSKVSEASADSSRQVEENILVTEKELPTANFPKWTDEVVRVPEHNSENNEDECVKTATAVVDQITEKAIELIQQQKDNQLLPEIKVSDEFITNKKDIEPDNNAAEINNHLGDDILNNEIVSHSKDASIEEAIAQLETSTIICDDTDLVKNAPLAVESHLHDCLKTTDKHIVEEENALATENCSDSVDITNAKDLKESTAAEVTTQDLPVICE